MGNSVVHHYQTTEYLYFASVWLRASLAFIYFITLFSLATINTITIVITTIIGQLALCIFLFNTTDFLIL